VSVKNVNWTNRRDWPDEDRLDPARGVSKHRMLPIASGITPLYRSFACHGLAERTSASG
jgi:hypothetical protein